MSKAQNGNKERFIPHDFAKTKWAGKPLVEVPLPNSVDNTCIVHQSDGRCKVPNSGSARIRYVISTILGIYHPPVLCTYQWVRQQPKRYGHVHTVVFFLRKFDRRYRH